MTEDPPHEPDDVSDDGSLRPIRALTRGLEALEALNARGQASVTEIARAIGLPRTTAYRVLETLCAGGYAERTAEDRYRLLARVQRLGDGSAPPPWLERVVKPATAALARELSWPLVFATLQGTEMRAHYLNGEPRIPERLPLTSSVGQAYVANCDETQRAALKAMTGSDILLGIDAAKPGMKVVEHSYDFEPQKSQTALAVPVLLGASVVGVLALRAPLDAIPPEASLRFIGLLEAAAKEIATAWDAVA
jgi:IclR family mhp operon transcriptional activator